MPVSSSITASRQRYHSDAYDFVFLALQRAQELLQRVPVEPDLAADEEEFHVTGPELLAGIQDLALEHFGLMSRTVFASWGISCTEDFGRIVFELVDEGRMRKTDRDQLSDFADVFDFAEAFDETYRPQTDFSPLH